VLFTDLPDPTTSSLTLPAPGTDGAPAASTGCCGASSGGSCGARLEELGRLQALVVSTTAHELRTPLTVLRVHADLLAGAGAALGPDDHASLKAIGAAVARLQEVSDRLVTELRDNAGGAEDALRQWLSLEQGSDRVRPV
jgi:signal transduction histidine kinase